MTEAAASAVAPDDTLSDDPIEVLQRRHAADLIYEQEHCRHRLKTQAQFYEMKLETSRLAAQVNVEHKAVEVAAACARNYEEKLKLLAAGGSLEAQLMIRIEEMGEELGRLHTFEKEMHAARQELSDKEAEFAKHRGDTEADMAKALRDKEAEMAMALRDKEAEFDKERGALLALREDVRTCQSLMARRVMDELGIDELSSGTGTDVEALQANVKEVLAKYGAKIRQLQAEVDAALKQRDELADASKAAEASKAAALEEVAALGMELLATRAAWDAAVAREAEALAETSDARAKLAEAHEQIGEISSQLSEMTAQARAAEDARDLAQAEARAILARTEARLVWAANDLMAFGAMDAVRERDLQPGRDMFFSGVNTSPEALQALRSGELSALAGGHFMLGAWALVIVHDHFKGIDFAASEGLEMDQAMFTLFSPALAQRFNQMFGEGRFDSIDFRRFSKVHNPRLKRYNFDFRQLLERPD